MYYYSTTQKSYPIFSKSDLSFRSYCDACLACHSNQPSAVRPRRVVGRLSSLTGGLIPRLAIVYIV